MHTRRVQRKPSEAIKPGWPPKASIGLTSFLDSLVVRRRSCVSEQELLKCVALVRGTIETSQVNGHEVTPT